ncbi:MAG: hypothetical protein E6J84_08465 [Deltaproteobacteria bacterium]|nr:MAG: hypothetical protein E6J84_08465 [Deltaproteobacteria bacterium]
MDIDVFSADELDGVFRVLRTALNPSGPLQPGERKLLETYSRITAYSLAGTDPFSIRPEEARVDGAHRRKRLVQLASIAALFSSPCAGST